MYCEMKETVRITLYSRVHWIQAISNDYKYTHTRGGGGIREHCQEKKKTEKKLHRY